MSIDDAILIDAINRDRLASLDDPAAQTVCRSIGRAVSTEVDRVVAVLTAAGLDAIADGDPGAPTQRHHAKLRMADADQAIAAARLLESHHYRSWEPIDGAAKPVLRRLRDSLTIARTDDVTFVLELRWPPSALAARLPSVLVPNEHDYRVLSLPPSLWPLYLFVRPIRLAVERLGLRPSTGTTLGPFLSTPTDLISPLLDLADVGPTDTLVDLGCGDGRILRHAVQQRGCRGVGVESDPELVAEARRLADADGLGERLTIVEGDAAGRLPEAAAEGTVFFLFIPSYAVPSVATSVVEQARAGARLVVHEQHPLPDLGSDIVVESVPLLAGQGVTVAHRAVIGADLSAGDDRYP